MRADHRSDLFSLGTVLFEMLTLERLFRGKEADAILARVVAGPIPRVRDRNPAVPAAVAAIVEQAIQRDPARRFPSAAAMGEACEHFLYDKGYGPTNLTLKRHLAALFPEARTAVPVEEEDRFPAVQSTLIPVGDGPTSRSRATGPLAGPRRKAAANGYTRVVTERPVVAAISSVRKPALLTTHRMPKTLPPPRTVRSSRRRASRRRAR
jgi:serine/threonine protein kinase